MTGPGFTDIAMAPAELPRGDDSPRLCGATTRSQSTCRRPAGWGTDHVGRGRCKLHGGSTPSHRQAAAREAAGEALAVAVRTYGLPVDVEPGEALLGLVRTSAGIVAWLGQQVGGLEEHRVLAGDKTNPLVGLYLEERRELARVSKMTLDAGVAERRVRLAEAQGELVVQVLEAFARGLGHDPADPQVRGAARAALLTVDGQTA